MARRALLTVSKIETLKTNKRREFADIPNLFLRVSPTGSKTWLFRYIRPLTLRRSWLTIGSYPAVSLSEARIKCEELTAMVKLGDDPKSSLDAEREKRLPTFYGVAEQWFAWRKTRNNFTEKTAKDTWRLLERNLFPVFGKLPIGNITAPMAILELEKIQQSGKAETRKRAMGKLCEIMVYALNLGIISHNPLANIGAMFDKPRAKHLAAMKPDELQDIFSTLAFSNIKGFSYAMLVFQLLTLARPAEAASARWECVDFNAGVWSYNVLKGNKEDETGRVHKVPLSRQALALLERLRQYSADNLYIFPHSNDLTKHANSQTVNAILKRCGFAGKQTAHGFRRMASTWLNEQLNADGSRKYDAELIEVALSHIDRNTVRSAYNSAEYLERRRRMLQDWADFVERAGGKF